MASLCLVYHQPAWLPTNIVPHQKKYVDSKFILKQTCSSKRQIQNEELMSSHLFFNLLQFCEIFIFDNFFSTFLLFFRCFYDHWCSRGGRKFLRGFIFLYGNFATRIPKNHQVPGFFFGKKKCFSLEERGLLYAEISTCQIFGKC